MRSAGLATRRLLKAITIVIVLATIWLGGDGPAWAQGSPSPLTGLLVASDAAPGDSFGSGVAISGDTAVVGAAGVKPSGAAYVFERAPGSDTWIETAKLTAGDIDEFGFSVSIDHDLIVVGAVGGDQGAAYLFGRDQGAAGAWGLIAELTPTDDSRDRVAAFGVAVSISGETVVVGASLSRVASLPGAGGVIGPGAAYIFEKDQTGSGAWTEVARLVGDPCVSSTCLPYDTYYDLFGYSVDISGETVVVGAIQPGVEVNYFATGAAYVFARDPASSQWAKVTTLDLPQHGWDQADPSRVAISGDTAIVSGAGPFGPIGIFERNHGGGNAWGLVATRTASTDSSHESVHVAIDGDLAIVTGRKFGSIGSTALVYSRNGGGPENWSLLTTVSPSDDPGTLVYGHRVAIDGDTVLVNGGPSFSGGSAYACRLDVAFEPDSACVLAQVVNSLVSLSVNSTSCCGDPAAPAFTITATLTNTSTDRLMNVFIEVTELTGGNLLRTADGMPGGPGATTTVPSLLFRPGDTATVTFEIALAERGPFTFLVNVRGTPPVSALPVP